MESEQLEAILAKRDRDERKRQSKRALFVTFVLIPVVVVLIFVTLGIVSYLVNR